MLLCYKGYWDVCGVEIGVIVGCVLWMVLRFVLFIGYWV